MLKGKILFAEKEGVFVLKFVGDIRLNFGSAINNVLDGICGCKQFTAVVIDLTETTGIDSTTLGLLAKVSMRTQEQFGYIPTLVSSCDDIDRTLMSMGFDKVFHIIKDSPDCCQEVSELELGHISEPEMRQQVLEAHRVLMDLNENNRETFQDLVAALSTEEKKHTLQPSDSVSDGLSSKASGL